MGLWIVRGIDRTNPHAYRLILGSNPDIIPNKSRFVNFVSRFHRIDAATSENLDRFLDSYKSIGSFYLMPAYVPSNFDGTQPPELDTNLSIIKRAIHVREVWEIGPNRIESVAVLKDDDPVIPKDIKNAPVLKLINSFR